MSSDKNNKAEKPVGAAGKRISALNVHEGHILQRRIQTYKKIHDKEIAEVFNKVEEIRESMRALSTDPLYGTHALTHEVNAPGSKSSAPALDQRQDSKLKRTLGFPEKTGESDNGGVSAKNISFPPLQGERDAAAIDLVLKSGGRGLIKDARKSKSLDSHDYHEDNEVEKEKSDMRGQRHRKLERCKTAPVTRLQPLWKTTPEMLTKKLYLPPSSNRLNFKESFKRAHNSPRFGNNGPWRNSPEVHRTQTGAVSLLHQRTASLDSCEHTVNAKSASQSGSESKTALLVNRGLTSARDDLKQHGYVKRLERRSSSSEISKSFQNSKQYPPNSDKGSDEPEHKSISDLKNCRYLRFTSQTQESNQI